MAENTKENCSEVADYVLGSMTYHEIHALAHECLYERFRQDNDAFQEEWENMHEEYPNDLDLAYSECCKDAKDCSNS